MSDKETKAYNDGYRIGQMNVVMENEKRNYLWDFAGRAMTGLLANSHIALKDPNTHIPTTAILNAKALIKQLEEL